MKIRLDNLPVDSDEFKMYCVKMRPCTDPNKHEWKFCPCIHEGEEFARRDFTLQPYIAVLCTAAKEGRACAQGETCTFAHNTFEMWLHPSRYRTTMCRDGYGCTRHLCFFAHGPEQLRQPDHSCLPPSLQLLAKQHEDTSGGTAMPKVRRSASRSPADARSPGSAHSPAISSQLQQLQASMQVMQLGGTQQLLEQLQQLQQEQTLQHNGQQSFHSLPASPLQAFLSSSLPGSDSGFLPSQQPGAGWGQQQQQQQQQQLQQHGLTAEGLRIMHNPALSAALRSPSPAGSDIVTQQWVNELQMSPMAARQQHDVEASFSWLVPTEHQLAADPSGSNIGGSFALPGYVHGGVFGSGRASPRPAASFGAGALLGSQPSSRSLSPHRPAGLQQLRVEAAPSSRQGAASGQWSPLHGAGSSGQLQQLMVPGFEPSQRQGSRSGTPPGTPPLSNPAPPALQDLRLYAAASALSASDAALVERAVNAKLVHAFAAGMAYAKQQQDQGQGHSQQLMAEVQGMPLQQLQQLCSMLQPDSPALNGLLTGTS